MVGAATFTGVGVVVWRLIGGLNSATLTEPTLNAKGLSSTTVGP
jgi:hypothetical protein